MSAEDFGPMREYPSPVHVVAFDFVGNRQIDEVYSNGWTAVGALTRFVGGTVTFFDAKTQTKLWEITRL